MANITFLGTGLLGSAFAEAAAKRGDTVTVWNRSPEKAESLKAFGITVAVTPADAVLEASRVHLVLKDDAVVDEVLAAARTTLSPSAFVLDHTTTLPASTAARALLLNSEGAERVNDFASPFSSVRLNAEQIQLVSAERCFWIGKIELQGA